MFDLNTNAFVSGMMNAYFHQNLCDEKHPCSKINCPMQYNVENFNSPCYSFSCQWYTPKYTNTEIAGFLRYLADVIEKEECYEQS